MVVRLRGQFDRRGQRAGGIAEIRHFQLLSDLPARRIDRERARKRTDVQEIVARAGRCVGAVFQREDVFAVLRRDEAEHGILLDERAVVILGEHGAVGFGEREHGVENLARLQPHTHDFPRDALPLFRLDDKTIHVLALNLPPHRRAERDGLRLVFFCRVLRLVRFLHERVRRDVKRAQIAHARRRPHADAVLAERSVGCDFDLRLELPARRLRDARHFKTTLIKKQPLRVVEPSAFADDLDLRPALPAAGHDVGERGRRGLNRSRQRNDTERGNASEACHPERSVTESKDPGGSFQCSP